MAPTGTSTGSFNNNISTDLTIWVRKTKLGYVFDSNTGFTLPNNAVRSPDAAFIKKEEWQKVALSDRRRFAHVCPDFVVELQSENDDPATLQQKMKEWMENGCSLAWMINPEKRETWIYKSRSEFEIKAFETILDGEDVLPGFTINLSEIFTEEEQC